jgi:hypothetical protein
MALKYTNKNNVSLALAVFLMYDDYEYDERPNSISATGLIRPLRQLILSKQNPAVSKTVDIADLVSTRMGSAIHKGCEDAWTNLDNVSDALRVLGASEDAISRIKINPETTSTGDTPVYVEQRVEKEIDDFIISGKYDLVLDGTLNDYKSTSVWSYIYDSNADSYIKQGSIYKWLSPDKITDSYMNINYIFTDWSAAKARMDTKSYPQQRVLTKKYPLWGREETQNWIQNKLAQYKLHLNTPQEGLLECTDEELWATEETFKYYKNPNKLDRSTKNFKTMNEALARKSADGNVGIIKTVPGEVKACRYCPVVGICTQAETMLAEGRLIL